MRQDILNRLRDDAVEHNGVTLELHTPDVGWAVFSGCEGEDPALCGVFFGRRAEERANALLAATMDDGGEQVPVVFDGCRVPAALTAEGLIVANHLPDGESIAALAEVTGIDPAEWGLPDHAEHLTAAAKSPEDLSATACARCQNEHAKRTSMSAVASAEWLSGQGATLSADGTQVTWPDGLSYPRRETRASPAGEWAPARHRTRGPGWAIRRRGDLYDVRYPDGDVREFVDPAYVRAELVEES